MKLVPLNKQSKKAQKKYHARKRKDWNGLTPTTRVVKSKKVYDRKNSRSLTNLSKTREVMLWNQKQEKN